MELDPYARMDANGTGAVGAGDRDDGETSWRFAAKRAGTRVELEPGNRREDAQVGMSLQLYGDSDDDQ